MRTAIKGIGRGVVGVGRFFANRWRNPTFGKGYFKAWGYQGFHELGDAFGKALPDSISVTEPGTLGAPPTPQEVFNDKQRDPQVPKEMNAKERPAEPEMNEPMPRMPVPDGPEMDKG